MSSFRYTAKVVKMIDGDTFEFEIDLGFNMKLIKILNLHEYDAPEIYGPNAKYEYNIGKKISSYAVNKLLNKKVEIEVFEETNFSTANVYILEENNKKTSFIDHLKQHEKTLKEKQY